jgi:hypothetical protein
VAEKVRDNDLTMSERRFLRAYIDCLDVGRAYRKVHPSLKLKSCQETGSRTLARIRARGDWNQLLEDAGLGDIRLMHELDLRLKATKIVVNVVDKQIVESGPYEDNITRSRATELLAKLLGRDVQKIAFQGGPPELVLRYEPKPNGEPSRNQPPPEAT